MLALLLIALQGVPDVSLNARVHADRVEIERAEGVNLTVRARPDAGSKVEVVKSPSARTGDKVLRDVTVTVDAEARLAPPETETPEQR